MVKIFRGNYKHPNIQWGLTTVTRKCKICGDGFEIHSSEDEYEICFNCQVNRYGDKEYYGTGHY